MEAVNNPKNQKEMSLLKNLSGILLIIMGLLVLVVSRNSDTNIFKEPVRKAIGATQSNGNLITPDQLKLLPNPYLVIDLRSVTRNDSIQFQHRMQIPFEKILDRENRDVLDQTKGNLILYSDDVATSSKAWVILNQLGYKNLLILTSNANTEELKYKFQPDTTARLEQDSI